MISWRHVGYQFPPFLTFTFCGEAQFIHALIIFRDKRIQRLKYILRIEATSGIEVCMGMGKTGIPWVPWDSHGNGSKISHGMGTGWEWELRRGNWKTTLHTVTSKHLQQQC